MSVGIARALLVLPGLIDLACRLARRNYFWIAQLIPVLFLFDGQAKKGLVPEFQAAALRAEIDELRRQGRANALVVEAYQVQLRNARAAEAAQIEKSEQEIADYEKKLAAAGRACLLDRDDLQFLRQ
ncbi:hypothetical protein GJU93_10885 [Brucella sp. 10RB9212]|uniref:hypothetical protein n=1 Tax=unclassified Brucella TaxID=2632610 RepID=UPI0012AEA131|nr:MULTISPECIES: hypothetical protein [unclassified Brucella]MRN47095.1 hypothetical protein [Brucella sp. 10RB9212]